MFKFGSKVKIVKGEMFGYISHTHPKGDYYSVQVTYPARLAEPLICYPHQLKAVPRWRNYDDWREIRYMFGCKVKIWSTGKVEVLRRAEPSEHVQFTYIGSLMRPARRSSNLI